MESLSKKVFCSHCQCYLSKKAYNTHKRLYYDEESSQWIKKKHSESYPEFEDPDEEDVSAFDFAGSSDSVDERPPGVVNFETSLQEGYSGSWDDSSDSTSDIDSSSSKQIYEESDFKELNWLIPDCDIEEVWSATDQSDINGDDYDCAESPPETSLGDSDSEILKSEKALVHWLVSFILLLQVRFYLTDNALELLFRFLKAFFRILGRIHTACSNIESLVPATLYMARKRYGKEKEKFQRYAVCKHCHSIYSLSSCTEGHGVNCKPKRCSHVEYRNRKPKVCEGMLLKTIELSTGKKIFYPFMTYCFIDLKTSLQNMMNQKEFITNCEKWKSRIQPVDTLTDIYDGNIWKKFISYNGNPFLSSKYSFALTLNLDWFQPYKHLSYSVGAIYLTVSNLPRSLRYKLENVCLVGILPGPHEPNLSVNSYIEPLVQDLLQFWEGVELHISSSCEIVRVRCAVLCVSCDLPAGRKLCGFLGHSSRLGCSRCKKEFSGSVGNLDYSGFNRVDWSARSASAHRQDALKLLSCATKTERQRLESQYGCRYSNLLKLPYFDPPIMLAIDVMHNLFLGIGKFYLKKNWIDKGYLGDSHFKLIQDRVDRMVVPADIGRIPTKIQSGFSSFTADQLKNWIIHYSIIALHGVLPAEHLECWRHFVLACRILCLNSIPKEKVKLADALILQFCKRIERYYGKEVITPNLHMSCHISECVFDFGPPHSFWLFAYERFNGILGSLPNNNRSIEVQMMNRFLSDKQVMSSSYPDIFQEDFEHLSLKPKQVGSLAEYMHIPSLPIDNDWSIDSLTSRLILPKHYRRGVFQKTQLEDVIKLFAILYSKSSSEIDANSTYQQYSFLNYNGMLLGSHKSRSHNSSIVLLEWNSDLLGPVQESMLSIDSKTYRPVRINFFAKHSVIINSKIVTHLLLSVSWFKSHPQKDVCGKPVTLWHSDIFELSDVYSLVPIQLVGFRTVSLVDKLDDSIGQALFISAIEH